MTRPCGNPECGISSSICDFFTFGSGELDASGYWEKPCAVCARQNEKDNPKDGACWPFTEEERQKWENMFKNLEKGKIAITT